MIPLCPTAAIPGYGDVFKHTNLYMVRTRPTPSHCCRAVSFIYLLIYWHPLEILVPHQGIEPVPPALRAQSPDDWTAGKAQQSAFKSNGKY